jgi:hypothetical protein
VITSTSPDTARAAQLTPDRRRLARRRNATDSTKSARGRIFRKGRTLDSPAYLPVLLILIVMAVGSVGAFFVLPPLLDRVGKVGIFGF